VVYEIEVATKVSRRDSLKVSVAFAGSAALAAWPVGQLLAAEHEVLHRQLRFTISLTNPLAEELPHQVLWLYLPVAQTPTQELDAVKVSMPHELISDALGHSIVKLSLASVAPLASKVVNVVADVRLKSEPVLSSLADTQDWLSAERFIEVADARIHAVATALKRPTAHETAHSIYDWVRQHLQYAGYVADDKGALYALAQRRGDCTEYAYLVVALSRANGIPARMVGGYVVDRNMALRSQDYHNWAEAYFDGAWRLIDAQKEHWLAPAEQYVAFRYYRDAMLNPLGRAHRYYMQGALEVKY